jgi:hypothetical protein
MIGYGVRLASLFVLSVLGLLSGYYLLTFLCLAGYYINDWIGD